MVAKRRFYLFIGYGLALLLLLLLIVAGVFWAFLVFNYGISSNELFLVISILANTFIVCPLLGCEIELPSGFELSQFAEAQQVPGVLVALDVDKKGRVVVADSHRMREGTSDNRSKPYWLLDDLASTSVADRQRYIEKWASRGEDPLTWYTANKDRVLRLSDINRDGKADDVSVLAEVGGVTRGLGAGVLAADNGIYYTNIPDLLWLKNDTEGTTLAQPEVLATGFGVKTSLSGHDMHGLIRGMDGRIYFSIGDRGFNVKKPDGTDLVDKMDYGRGAVFRMQPDGSELEVYAWGLRNPQELAFDNYANLITVDNNGDGGDKARVVYVVENGDSGWSMSFQSLEGDYLRGPWNSEKLWHLYHEGQAAWIIPPIAHLTQGPAGLAHYPGLGFPQRYQDHFFICDYAYSPSRSGIRSFAIKAKGAGFSVVDAHDFITGMLATDVVFDYQGRMIIGRFDQFGGFTSRIDVLQSLPHSNLTAIATVTKLMAQGLAEETVASLVNLLSHPDQRLRLAAQFELVERQAFAALAATLHNPNIAQLGRLHGLWGLGQLGEAGLRQGNVIDIEAIAAGDDEILAQLVRVAGDNRALWLAAEIHRLLQHPSARVQYFAALTLGKLAYQPAIEDLFDLLKRNQDKDPFLRHAVVMGLYYMDALDLLVPYMQASSVAVRMGMVLVLRRLHDPRLKMFLQDTNPLIVLEAARAIHDLRIKEAMEPLAQLANMSFCKGHTQDNCQSLTRRVLSANIYLGDQDSAFRLARFAASPLNQLVYRQLALQALGNFTEPERDIVNGYYRPVPVRPDYLMKAALQQYLPQLLKSPLEERAEQLAIEADVIELDMAEWLNATVPEKRMNAREILLATEPSRVVDSILKLPANSPLKELQHAIQLLGQLSTPKAVGHLENLLKQLQAGTLPPQLAADVVEVASQSANPVIAEQLSVYRAGLNPQDPLASYRVALSGGDAKRGRALFSRSDGGACIRCHSLEKGVEMAGPSLANVAQDKDLIYLLESLIIPEKNLASGYPKGGMPPVGDLLTLTQLRDLIAFLATLQ